VAAAASSRNTPAEVRRNPGSNPPSCLPAAVEFGSGHPLSQQLTNTSLSGGHHFSRDLRPVDAEGNEISMWSADAQKKNGSGEEEDNSSEDESDDGGPSSGGPVSREARKQEKKARKEAAAAKAKAQSVQAGDLPPSGSDSDDSDDSDDAPANPNHSKAARSQTKGPASVDSATEGVENLSVGTPSRKERESIQAQQAKDHYRKLHEQGKTDEAKADLARLKLIREKREAEAARKQVRR